MDKFFIDKLEVLRYLGHKGQIVESELNNDIENLINIVATSIKPRYIFESYDISREVDGIHLNGTQLILKGNDIKSCLENCDRVYLMAVTLGVEMERLIRVRQSKSLTEAVILDSIATAYVEEVCDKIEEDIYNKESELAKSLSFRYSPGYGDLPLEIQKDFVRTLNATRIIGLTVSQSDLLIPRKSVTAILGVKNEVKKRAKRECINCPNYNSCKFRKDGARCGD